MPLSATTCKWNLSATFIMSISKSILSAFSTSKIRFGKSLKFVEFPQQFNAGTIIRQAHKIVSLRGKNWFNEFLKMFDSLSQISILKVLDSSIYSVAVQHFTEKCENTSFF